MPLTTEDRLEIMELGARYCHGVDSKDADLWLSTFAEGGVVESPFGTPRGHAELRAWISGIVASLGGTRHFSVNELVGGDGDTARMRSYFFVINTDAPPIAVGASGSYDDDLEKVDGR